MEEKQRAKQEWVHHKEKAEFYAKQGNEDAKREAREARMER